MALLKIHTDLLFEAEIFELLFDSFDVVQEVRREHWHGHGETVVLRVINDEISDSDDVGICPVIQTIEGVRPFIISWDEYLNNLNL